MHNACAQGAADARDKNWRIDVKQNGAYRRRPARVRTRRGGEVGLQRRGCILMRSLFSSVHLTTSVYTSRRRACTSLYAYTRS